MTINGGGFGDRGVDDWDAYPPDGVVIRCQENRSAAVRLCDRSSPGAGAVRYAVEVTAPGVRARVEEVVAWTGMPGLARFLEGTAAEYRGWDGERCWRTDDRDLTVSAVFRSGGHVGLNWTLRPWRRAAGGWTASVTVWLEAGQQLADLAADVRHFLGE